MYEDDTIRLFGVANLLKNKKNDKDNWERDDIPDIKEQALTGKYDHNFDAPGSDFQRAHHYNFNNADQPENTKSDINYNTDKYTKFFNYTPSKYVQLEEDEYKPIGKYNEKADEYYIDNLKGKTLDDMVIGKMKENAEAIDLPRDAARRQFVEDLIPLEVDGLSVMDLSTGQPITKGKIRQEKIQNQQAELEEEARLQRKNDIVIERPHFSKLHENLAERRNQRNIENHDKAVAGEHYDKKSQEKSLGKLLNNVEKERLTRYNNEKADAHYETKQKEEGFEAAFANAIRRKKTKEKEKLAEDFAEKKTEKRSEPINQLKQGLRAFSNNRKRKQYKTSPQKKEIDRIKKKEFGY